MMRFRPLPLSPQQRGVMLALVGIGCLGLMNALVKWYSQHYSSMQLLFYRNIIGLLIFITIVAAHGGKSLLQTQRPMGHFWRGVLGTSSLGLSFYCYYHLPLGTAVSIVLTYPLFVALFSKWYLGESMPRQFWLYLLLGFAGVVLISQPTMGGEWWIIALGLLNALLWAMARMTTRSLTRTDKSVTISFYYLLIGSIGPAVFLLSIPDQWQPLQQSDCIGLLMLGSMGAIAQLLLTRALALAPAWRVAPLEYSLLLWAIGFDWLWWDKLPAFASLVGAALIAVVGVSLLGRRAKAVTTPPISTVV
jgi:drug/metabolite transporter (DMT)-like permease